MGSQCQPRFGTVAILPVDDCLRNGDRFKRCRVTAHQFQPGSFVMSLRIPFSLAALLALSACGSGEGDPNRPAEGDERLACAVGGQAEFAEVCAVDRVQQDGKLNLVVRHPDGGFRRFEVLIDGRGLAVVDGADQAVSSLEGAVLNVTVGGDRYRFPVTPKGNAAKP